MWQEWIGGWVDGWGGEGGGGGIMLEEVCLTSGEAVEPTGDPQDSRLQS